MSRDDPEDDHYPYADAVACALAAVLLLFVAAVVNRGAGEHEIPSYGVLTLEFEYEKVPARPLASIDFEGQTLAEVATDGEITPGPWFTDSEPTPGRKLRGDSEIQIHGQDGSDPGLLLTMGRHPELPIYSGRGGAAATWSAKLNIQTRQAIGTMTTRIRFDPMPDGPRRLVVTYRDNQVDQNGPTLKRTFDDFGLGPTTIEVSAGGQDLAIRRERP